MENKENKDTDIHTIETLSPKVIKDKIELEKIQPYLDRLKQAVEHPEVLNVALMGGYGSGKSTILETYKEQDKNVKNIHFLNISLASFPDKNNIKRIKKNTDKSVETKCLDIDSSVDDDSLDLEEKLQTSILQQMFYQFKVTDLPDSSFKRIQSLSKNQIVWYSTILILWISSLLLFLKGNYFNYINPVNWTYSNDFVFSVFFIILIIIGGFFYFLVLNFRTISKLRIRKVSPSQIELGDNQSNDVFDKFLDEILYFFNQTKVNVVYIQDLDRFHNTQIFTKLREVNYLINQHQKENKVTFIYAIKDDLFTSKHQRLKFFDYIIPIIPYIDSSNADDQFVALIKKKGLEEELSPDFIRGVTIFIDDIDMRMLINILNEYILYRKLIENNSSLEKEKLFAIITYKNLFPDDFPKLQKNKGQLSSFFSLKATYIEKSIEDFKNKIADLNAKIEAIKSEKNQSIDGLRKELIYDVLGGINTINTLSLNSRNVTLNDLLITENFEEVLNNKLSSNYVGRLDFSAKKDEYIKCSELINGKSEILDKQKQIDELEYDIKTLKDKSIKELFDEGKIDDSILTNNLDNNVVRHLIFKGFIDESFGNYISLFHEITLTKNDILFIQNIASRRKLLFDLELTHLDNILGRINISDYKRVYALNYDLLNYLLKREHNSDRTLNLISTLESDIDLNFEFIDGFIARHSNKVELFIKHLVELKPNLYYYIFENSKKDIDRYLGYIFNYANYSSIEKLTGLELLDNYFAAKSDFFNFCRKLNQNKTIIEYLDNRGLAFENLDSPEEQDDILKVIYVNNLYEFSEKNIYVIVSSKIKEFDKDKFENSNYSYIKKLKLEELLNNIEQNPEPYFTSVTKEFEKNKKETDETILEVLNNEVISLELKTEFIEKQEKIIDDISQINKINVKQMLFKEEQILKSWDNILNYYQDTNEIDEVLFDYLNKEYISSELQKNKIKSNDGDIELNDANENLISELSEAIVYNNKFNIEPYKNLLKSISDEYSSFIFNKIDADKTEAVLNSGLTPLTLENLIYLKEQGEDMQIVLLEKYKDEFIDQITEFKTELDKLDWKLILESDYFTSKEKAELAPFIHEQLIQDNEPLQKLILKLSKSEKLTFNFSILDKLFIVENVDDLTKIKLLTDNFNSLSNQNIENLARLIDEKYDSLFELRKRPFFVKSEILEQFIRSLKNRNMINSFKVEGERINVVANYEQ